MDKWIASVVHVKRLTILAISQSERLTQICEEMIWIG